MKVVREEGFLADRVTMLSDTTNAEGAGATQDTFTLLRKGVRKLLKEMKYHLPVEEHGLADDLMKDLGQV